MKVKKAQSGTGKDGEDIIITEQDIKDFNNNNQEILAKINEIQSSLISINNRIDNIDKKEKENWFVKNLKSPNFFAIWFPTMLVGLLTGVVYVGKLVLKDKGVIPNSKSIINQTK